MFVTLETTHVEMSPLKEGWPRPNLVGRSANVDSNVVTFDTSQDDRSALKDVASEKVDSRVLTLPTSQEEMSLLKR